MVRGWVYSIIGGVVALFAFRSMVRDAIRELLQAPAQAARPRRGPAGRTDLAAAGLNQSGVIPEVAPSVVQTRTMSRIESTPTSSEPS